MGGMNPMRGPMTPGMGGANMGGGAGMGHGAASLFSGSGKYIQPGYFLKTKSVTTH